MKTWLYRAIFNILILAVFSACAVKQQTTNSTNSSAGTPTTGTTTSIPTLTYPSKLTFSGIGTHGIFDASLAAEPTGRLWMSYSTVDVSGLWPTQNTDVISTRLAYSNDWGHSWADIGSTVNPFIDVTTTLAAPDNAGTWVNEVSQIVYDPSAAIGEHYKLIWHHYLILNGQRHFEHGWLGMKLADAPADLVTASEIKLFSGYNYSAANNVTNGATQSPLAGAPQIALDTAYSADLNNCIFTEPGMYGSSSALYLTVLCSKPTDGEKLIVLIKCAGPCNVSNQASWTYVATLFNKASAAAYGFDSGFSATGLFQGSDNNIYLTVTPQQTAGAPWSNYYTGCYIYKFTNIDTGTLQATPVKIVSGTSGSFNGACTYHKLATKSGLIYGEVNTSLTAKFQLFLSGLNF